MSDRLIEFIKDEIATLSSTRKSITQGSIFIQCPYHEDRTPSGGINIDATKTVPLGWFSCFGCKKSVSWNELSTTLGLKSLKPRDSRRVSSKDYLDPSRLRNQLLGEEEEDNNGAVERDMKELDFFDFPPEISKWRGYKVSFLASLGARYAFHDRMNAFVIWFPCLVLGKQVGYIKAYLEKEPGRPSYINSPGKWSRTEGLLFFDSAIKMMKEQQHETIVLVEGPRDALRCLRSGIPATSILGTQAWSEEKRLVLERAGVQNVVIFMDGDKPDKQGIIPGKKATQMLVKSLKGFLNYRYVNMWKYEQDWDPGNCPKRFLHKVKASLTSF